MTEGITPPQPPNRPPAPAAPPAAAPPASYNERQDVGVRPCAACGGQLEFDITRQQLTCTHCGAGQAIIEAPGAVVAEQSFAKAAAIQNGAPQIQGLIDGEKEIICQNCGGHTTFVGTWTATKCPYCATDLQRTDIHDAPERLAVDGVLPFQVNDKQAAELLNNWVNKRWFAPSEFKKYSNAGSFESVYTAYFTFDAETSTDYRGERGENRTRTYRDGNETKTVVETDWYGAAGRVFNSFDDITIQGNTGLEARFVDKLEPWPTQFLKPFNPDYMVGHLSRTYDKDVETCFGEARKRMESTIDQTIRQDIGGDQQRIHHKDTTIASRSYKHVLLPIWLLTVIYAGQPWQVFINGATGEIHGERPWSKVKIIATVIAVLTLIILVLVAPVDGRRLIVAATLLIVVLLVVAIVVVGGAAVALGAGGAIKRRATKSTQTVPGIAAVVPEHWFGSHEPEAVLHRRVQQAYLGIKASADNDLTLLDATTTAESQAIKLATQLVACSHLAERLKGPVLAGLEKSVERYEEIAAQVIGRSSGFSSPQLSSELHDLGHQLDILEAARAEVEEADGSTG